MRNSIASCRSICVHFLRERNRMTARVRPYYTRSVGLPGSCIVGAGLAPALATGRRPPSMLRFLDWCLHQITPFSPRSIVITDTWIAKQTSQHKPGMRRTLTDTTIGYDILFRCDVLAYVDLVQLLSRLERAIRVCCCSPGNALCGRNVSTTLRTLLWVVHHVDQFASIFL